MSSNIFQIFVAIFTAYSHLNYKLTTRTFEKLPIIMYFNATY